MHLAGGRCASVENAARYQSGVMSVAVFKSGSLVCRSCDTELTAAQMSLWNVHVIACLLRTGLAQAEAACGGRNSALQVRAPGHSQGVHAAAAGRRHAPRLLPGVRPQQGRRGVWLYEMGCLSEDTGDCIVLLGPTARGAWSR